VLRVTQRERFPALKQHEFALFDGRILLNGRSDWARAARERNVENAVVTRHSDLVETFARKFDELWTSYASLEA
jgi:hypothetical protein